MAKQFPSLSDDFQNFIAAQPMFFVATAAADGRVNMSPKGMDSLRVLGPNKIIWRNLTGSGNETAGHLRQVNRMTLMWCGFEKRPLILRAYGTADTLHIDHADFAKYNDLFPDDIGARQIYDVTIGLVQSSCGYAVPFMEHQGERPTLKQWTKDKGTAGIHDYWTTKNQTTLDGAPTYTPMPNT
ncbi:MAG: pyridoxamine 5'-phosphate oxidase family protein [Paracoccaceae bacterium]